MSKWNCRNNLPNSKPGQGVPRLSGGKPGGKGSPSRPQGTPGVVKVSQILSTLGKGEYSQKIIELTKSRKLLTYISSSVRLGWTVGQSKL